ncbi:hypothetical protein SB763_33455, partial [Burkholderia sp. SIMBA_042]
MTNEHERVIRKKKLNEELENEERIKLDMGRLESDRTRFVRLQLEQAALEKVLRDEDAFYEELGKMKDK